MTAQVLRWEAALRSPGHRLEGTRQRSCTRGAAHAVVQRDGWPVSHETGAERRPRHGLTAQTAEATAQGTTAGWLRCAALPDSGHCLIRHRARTTALPRKYLRGASSDSRPTSPRQRPATGRRTFVTHLGSAPARTAAATGSYRATAHPSALVGPDTTAGPRRASVKAGDDDRSPVMHRATRQEGTCHCSALRPHCDAADGQIRACNVIAHLRPVGPRRFAVAQRRTSGPADRVQPPCPGAHQQYGTQGASGARHTGAGVNHPCFAGPRPHSRAHATSLMPRCSARAALGGCPMMRLKARLNEASES